MIESIKENYEWLFSGLGVAILGWFIFNKAKYFEIKKSSRNNNTNLQNREINNSTCKDIIDIQVGNNLSINYDNTLEKLLHNILYPASETIRNEVLDHINKTVGVKIEEIIKNTFKEKKFNFCLENIKYHYQKVCEYENIESNDLFSKIDTLEKKEQFASWFSVVENIPASEKILSEIWERLLHEIIHADNKKLQTLKLFKEKMHMINSQDAEILSLMNQTVKKRSVIFKKQFNNDQKMVYSTIKKLYELELLEVNTAIVSDTFAWFLMILSVILFGIAFYTSIFAWVLIIALVGGTISIGAIFYLAYKYSPKYYRLSWIGKGILGYKPSHFFSNK